MDRTPPGPEKTNPPDPASLAAEADEGGRDRNLAARLGRYGTGKARAYQMAGYVLKDHGEDKLSHKLYRCGGHLHFREWVAHDSRMTLHKGYFCQVPLLCPVCAIRRGGKMLRRYHERAAYLLRSHDAYMVTLTVKNRPDLAEAFEHLRTGLRRLRERAKKGYGILSTAKGYVGSFEFTKSAHGWHPHVHMVWFVPKGTVIRWGEGSQLRADWHAVTGDSFITNAKPLYGDSLIDGFCEVLKYALKFSTLDLADNFEAFKVLKGKRLITSGGLMYGLELPEDARLEDDPLDGPFIEHIYRWTKDRYELSDVWDGYVAPETGTLAGPFVRTTIAPQEVTHADSHPPLRADQSHALA